MGGPDRLTRMTAALGEYYLHTRMVHKNPQKLTGGVTGGPDDSYLYFLISGHHNSFSSFSPSSLWAV